MSSMGMVRAYCASMPPEEGAGQSLRVFTCAWLGHALVGMDVAIITPEDSALARERDGVGGLGASAVTHGFRPPS